MSTTESTLSSEFHRSDFDRTIDFVVCSHPTIKAFIDERPNGKRETLVLFLVRFNLKDGSDRGERCFN